MEPGTSSTVAMAGPSSLPEKPVAAEVTEKRPEDKKRRRPKRKRVASEVAATEAGEVGPSDAPVETYNTPWLEKLGTTVYESKEKRLHDEIVAFFEYMTPTADERHARAMVIAQVAEVVKRRLPKAAVDTFGSVAQDLYLPDGYVLLPFDVPLGCLAEVFGGSDTDLVISTPHTYDDETKKRVLFQLSALMRNSHVTDYVQVVHRARVPVISFTTSPDLGSLKIDISLNATDGLNAVPVLRGYFERMPALRYLVLALKSLLTRHRLNSASSSGLSSYGLICLAISFLQLNPLSRPAEYIEKPLESASLGVLLMDFLQYYADVFPYETSYVSVTQGKVLLKADKGWTNESRPESLCIECLLNPDNDVGRPTSKIRAIRALFRESHSTLESYPFAPLPDPLNVLGTILGVSESTLEHRALLKSIVNSGRLTQALQDVQRSGHQSSAPGRRPPPSTAQQPYPPPRHYTRGPRYGPVAGSERSQRPPANHSLPARPPMHPSLPARPSLPAHQSSHRAPQGPSIGSMRGGGGGGRLIDRLDEPQPSRRRRT
ncbi:Nucleotidyltransferase [Cubamyces sp. BRFM 1775]|nr:Nucleotidyltransferase [Cubamyces sp. BRFM 1775]